MKESSGDRAYFGQLIQVCGELGIGTGRPVRPLQELSAEAKRDIDALTVIEPEAR